jgi:hypothetical protein
VFPSITAETFPLISIGNEELIKLIDKKSSVAEVFIIHTKFVNQSVRFQEQRCSRLLMYDFINF